MKFLAELGTLLSPGRLSGNSPSSQALGILIAALSFRFADDITAAIRQRIFLPFAEVPSAFIGNPKSHAGHVVAADQPFLFALGGIAARQTQREHIASSHREEDWPMFVHCLKCQWNMKRIIVIVIGPYIYIYTYIPSGYLT